ncbi:hypothetical protein RQP46_003758 [Phenoliferia psychrophenolica]
MNATIHSLAPELLDHILSLVCGPSIAWRYIDAVPNNSDLLSAALVCRSWAEAAQRVLWRDARITLDESEPSEGIPKPKYPIKRMWIAVRARNDGRQVEEDQAKLNNAMTRQLTAWLEDAPHVKSLCVTTRRGNEGPKWSFLQSASLSGLTRLDLEFYEEAEDPIETLTSFPFRLTQLGLAIYSAPPSSHLLRALFSASRTTLTSLRLSISSSHDNTWDDKSLLSEEFILVGSILQKLVIEFSSSREDAQYLDVGALVELKVLKLDLSYGEASQICGQLFSIRPYLDQLSKLPLQLKHLGASITDITHISDASDAISHSALDHLEVLELTNLDKSELGPVEGGAQLMDECERRSIRLVFRQDLLL